jgi:hypothetical protein
VEITLYRKGIPLKYENSETAAAAVVEHPKNQEIKKTKNSSLLHLSFHMDLKQYR